MNLHKLAEYFEGKVGAGELLKCISAEVEEYKRNANKKGSSLPIYADYDDFQFIVDIAHVSKLCQSYISGIFNEWDISYICNLLELSESFEPAEENVEEAIFLMSDPIVNYPISERLCNLILSWTGSPKKQKLTSYLKEHYH